ncbi:riboflavin biosynthesis protein RibD [Actinomycetospora sp. NBRC 106375]|uniref:dihydrofolate reductase family protein n=1 Tax=Actinomycetospora sp. NBRC 106375 TaxID=3032207 RepID=UPI0024A24DBA|nr:dihydrofolate reductase family protein [Actinomycetospora sp. NBRC 106375]GLZ44089.1 riboflavin biosynthesis protein RibD [Actinomycetospora sp. NBRC 106375]
MGKVVVAQFVTLDGRTEDPDGSAGTPHGGWAFRHPEAVAGDKFRLGATLDTGVKLLGRSTWELFSRIFPHRDDPFSRRLNAMEKLVVSRSLTDVGAWPHSTLLAGDLVTEVARRRERQDVIVTGSGTVVDALVAADLVDEFRLLVFPVVLGYGRRLFDAGPQIDVELTSLEDAGHGIVRQVHARRPAARAAA